MEIEKNAPTIKYGFRPRKKHINEHGDYIFLDYCKYYSDHIQIFEDYCSDVEKPEETRINTGISFDHYLKELMGDESKANKELISILVKLSSDEELYKLQKELEEKKGIELCTGNLYYLGLFLLKKYKSYKYMRLKPRIKDTLSELTEVSEITFTNKDGSKHSTDTQYVINLIINNLKEKEEADNLCEIKWEFLEWGKLGKKEFLQMVFIRDMNAFLLSYFSKNRKSDKISTIEQKIIIRIMKLLGIISFEFSDSRYRQLYSKCRNIHLNNHIITITNPKTGKPMTEVVSFIPYKVWRNGKIDWSIDMVNDFIPEPNLTYMITK